MYTQNLEISNLPTMKEPMKLLMVNIYPDDSIARYTLSSYVLKAYLDSKIAGDNMVVEVVNFSPAMSTESICNEIKKHSPNVIGYSSYVWNIEKFIDVIKTLRAEMDFVHILGGPEISMERITTIGGSKVADFYIIGEGEIKLTNLMKYLMFRNAGMEMPLPPGIVGWEKDGANMVYQEDAAIVPLEDIPSIYLTGVLEDKYYKGGQVFVETQRGCKYRCKYCVYHKNLPHVSYYPIGRVLEEIDYLIVEKKVLALRFIDAVFTSDMDRAKLIVEHLAALKEKGINIPWIYWEFDYESVDDRFLEGVATLKKKDYINNCEEAVPVNRPQIYSQLLKDYTAVNCLGVQSFNEKSLKAVSRRPVDRELFGSFMEKCRELNIVLKMDFILGLPFETLDSYFEGLEFILPFLRQTDHVLNIHVLQVLPGTGIEKLYGDYDMQFSINAPHCVLSTNGMSREEISSASTITAVLFRIINSPLREAFFEMKERTGEGYISIIRSFVDKIMADENFASTSLVKDDRVDDVYWNQDVFREIPTDWLQNELNA